MFSQRPRSTFCAYRAGTSVGWGNVRFESLADDPKPRCPWHYWVVLQCRLAEMQFIVGPEERRNSGAPIYLMSAKCGGLNRSTQHFILKRKDGVYGDASRIFRGFRRERDLSVYSQAYLNKVARQIKERPRPRDSKPQQRFNASVASTGWAGRTKRTKVDYGPGRFVR